MTLNKDTMHRFRIHLPELHLARIHHRHRLEHIEHITPRDIALRIPIDGCKKCREILAMLLHELQAFLWTDPLDAADVVIGADQERERTQLRA